MAAWSATVDQLWTEARFTDLARPRVRPSAHRHGRVAELADVPCRARLSLSANSSYLNTTGYQLRGRIPAVGLVRVGENPDRDGSERTPDEREIALLLEFDRGPGDGLTREEASRACKRHGFTPQTVGAWARAAFLKTRDDGLRYLGPEASGWLRERGVEVSNP